MLQHTSIIHAPAISIANLNLNYQHHRVFHNFNLTFPAGKWTALLGPSGVGKTTILRFIANLITVEDTKISGSITATDTLAIDTRLSYMAQRDLLMPWLSVLDNVLIGYKLRNVKNIKQQKALAIELLQQVGLKKTIALRPENLSGGMRQRVALVRTLLENRPIVLMDEPFSALDTITRLKLQELAAQLLGKRTVILVTHDPLEALRLCEHIYVIKGEPAEVSEFIPPKESIPRDPSDQNLLVKYAELLQVLGREV